jgi:hypothetical protein
VGSHINQVHKIKAREYRKMFGFDVKKGQLPPKLKELKSRLAIERGGYKNLKAGKKFWFKKKQKNVGVYTRSEQTLERLRSQTRRPRSKKLTTGCVVCSTPLTGNQLKYCSKECRKKDYKKKYNPHKIKLFENNYGNTK